MNFLFSSSMRPTYIRPSIIVMPSLRRAHHFICGEWAYKMAVIGVRLVPKTGILPGDARARLAFAEQMPKCPQERIKDV